MIHCRNGFFIIINIFHGHMVRKSVSRNDIGLGVVCGLIYSKINYLKESRACAEWMRLNYLIIRTHFNGCLTGLCQVTSSFVFKVDLDGSFPSKKKHLTLFPISDFWLPGDHYVNLFVWFFFSF